MDMGDVLFDDERSGSRFEGPAGSVDGEKMSFVTRLFMKIGIKSKQTANIVMIVFSVLCFLVSFYFFGFFG